MAVIFLVKVIVLAALLCYALCVSIDLLCLAVSKTGCLSRLGNK